MSKNMETLLDEAEKTADAAEAAEAALCDALQTALRVRMPVGLVIDITPTFGLAEHLQEVKTLKGADRGTRRFRIESAPIVEFRTRFPTLASWTCRATPISERTGKDMSGATRGGSGSTVLLKGGVFSSFPPAVAFTLQEHAARERRRILEFLAAVEPSSGAAARPAS